MNATVFSDYNHGYILYKYRYVYFLRFSEVNIRRITSGFCNRIGV